MADSIGITPIRFLLRVFSAGVGGLFGTLMLLFVFILSSQALNPILQAEDVATTAINPVFLAIFLVMMFTGLIAANLSATMLISFTDKDRYVRRVSMLHQIFIFNVVLFFIALPFYVFSLVMSFGILSIIALLHSFLALAGTHLILEIMAHPRYSLVSVYGTCLGLLIGSVVSIIVFQIMGTINVLMFVFLPFMWVSMGIAQGLVESLYTAFYRIYGIDWLKTETSFGADAYPGEHKTELEEVTEEVLKKSKDPKDVTGAEFLEK